MKRLSIKFNFISFLPKICEIILNLQPDFVKNACNELFAYKFKCWSMLKCSLISLATHFSVLGSC